MANKSTPARWIPKGSAKVALKNGAAVAYLSGGGAARPFAVAYIGNSGKPAWSYSFKDEARRAAYVSSWLASMEASKKARDARVAERKAKLAKPHGLKVGDVLSGSWGYDQTNVEFWEVTKLVGKRMVEIRELACESVETGYMQGNAVPLPGNYTAKEARRLMVNENDSVKLFSFGCYLNKAAPVVVAGKAVGYRPASWTAYA